MEREVGVRDSLDDDWASGVPINTAKLLLVASEGATPEFLESPGSSQTLLPEVAQRFRISQTSTVDSMVGAAVEEFFDRSSAFLGIAACTPLPILLPPPPPPPPPKPPLLPRVGPERPSRRPMRRATHPCVEAPAKSEAVVLEMISPRVDEMLEACSESGIGAHNRSVSAPPRACPVTGAEIRRPPKSTTGARKARYHRADATPLTMAPMLRARHMDLLDEQYIKDSETRADAGSNEKRRRPGLKRGRTFPLAEEGETAIRRPSGPKAAIAFVRGQLRVRAEVARREADREVRDAQLKDQFRSRLSTCSRAKSEPRKQQPAGVSESAIQ